MCSASTIHACSFAHNLLLVFTDDILATGPTEQLRSYGKALGKRFSVRGGGTPGLYCGMELRREPHNGPIYVSMVNYTKQMIAKFMPGDKINPSGSPSPVDPITKDDELQECDFPVRSAVGSLLYLAIVLRFDNDSRMRPTRLHDMWRALLSLLCGASRGC